MSAARVAVLRFFGTVVLFAVVGLAAVLGVSAAADSIGGQHERGPVVIGASDVVESAAAQRELDETAIRTAPRVVAQSGHVEQGAVDPPRGRLLDRLTTPFARSYAQADGTVVSRVSATPVNYRDAQGDWKTIDDRLVPDAAGVRVAADRYGLRLPGSLADGAIALSGADRGVSFQLDGARDVSGTTSGRVQTFANVLPGTSVSYAATPRGVSETLTLSDASAPQAFTYSLALDGGLVPDQLADGGIAFRDSDGQIRFSIAPAFMYDDAAARGASFSAGETHVVPMRVARDGAGWRLTVSPDRDWVLSHLPDGPVHVDPEWVFDDDGADCRIDETNPTTSYCGGTNLEVGWNGSKDHRSLLYFDLGTALPKDAIVTEALLGMYLYSHSTSTAKQVGAYRVAQPWTSSATWNKYDSTHSWTTPGGDSSSTYGAVTSGIGTANGWTHWYPTQIVQQWADGSQPNNGFLLKDAQSAVNNDLNFRSGTYSDDDYWPYLDVQWRLRTGDRPSYTFIRQQLNDRTDLGINVANGNLLVHSKDMHIAGTSGYDLNFDRYYNSLLQNIGYVGSQGAGATTGLGLDRWVRGLDDGSVEVFMGDGSVFPFIANGDGTFQSPPGLDSRLSESGGDYTLTFNDSGEQWIFNDGIDTEITAIKDRFGNTISNGHRAGGSVSAWTDTQGRSVAIDTDGSGHRYVTHFEDWTGRDWSYAFDAGYTHLTTYTDPDGNATTYGYDGSGRLTSVTLPTGNVTRFTYDGTSGRVASVIRTTDTSHTTGPTTTFSYGSGSPCATGEAKTVVSDPDANGSNGHTMTYCTNSHDAVTKTVDSDGNAVTSTYTSNDDVATETPASGGVNTYGYDAVHNLISLQQGGTSGLTKTFAYSDANDPHLTTAVTDPQGNVQNNDYAGLSDSDGPEGALLQIDTATQSPSVEATFTYNGNGTVATSTDPNGSTTSYGYDSLANLTSVTPPSGSGLGVETIAPDSLGRAHVVTQHLSGTLSRSATYTYDNFDRITAVTYANSNGTGVISVTRTYDHDGNLTATTDPQGTTSHAIDALNRVTQDSMPGGHSNTYTHDAAGNLTSYADGSGTTAYTYNGLNQLVSMTEPGDSSPTTFTYDVNGRLTRTTYPGGVTINRAYDGSTGQLTGLTTRKPPAGTGVILRQYTFDYQSGSVATGLVRSRTTSDGTNTDTTSYTYDALNRLSSAVTTGATTNQYFSYTLDANGNRTRQVANLAGSTSTGATTTSYAYDSGSSLCWVYTGVSSNGCTNPPTGATSYSYNQAGDTTSATSGVAFTYNNAAQTTGITPAGGSAQSLSYLGSGQADLTQSGSTAMQNSDLGVTSTNESGGTTYYGRTPNGMLVDERTPSGRYWYVFGNDTLGSVEGVVDSSGNYQKHVSYGPYGEITSATGSDANPFWFAGGYQGGAGLYHFGERYYDPQLGRWTQRDPLQQVTDLTQVDRFAYAGDNPVNRSDTSGQATASGGCIRGWVRFNEKACKRAGYNIVDKSWFDKDHDKKTAWQKACFIAGGGLLLIQPETRLVNFAFNVLGGATWLSCY